MSSEMRKRLIDEYHAILMGDERITPELFHRLQGGMAARHLLYGKRELGISLRPHFLTRRQYDRLVHYSETLAGAFDKVAQALLDRPERMDLVGLRERERSLALVDPGYGWPAINTRLDAFIHGDEIKFVEYNAENPSSLTDQPGLNQVLFEMPAMERIAERYRLRQFTPVASLMEAMVATYREWGGTGVPRIAIIDWAELPTSHEFILLRNYLVGHGLPTIICTPDELEYVGGKLRRGEFVVDLAYKRIIIHELLSRYDDTHPLIQAYRNGDVCLINPFRCKMLHKKASFELLSDEAYESWYTAEERRVIGASIPWTRRVFERRTTFRGEEIDLTAYLRRHREDLVLKPNDDYGGHGIFIGHLIGEREWDRAIDLALREDYVVQERLEIRLEEFPIFRGDDWSIQPMFVDTNPFLFRGRVDGALVRLADSPIVNVTSGGGETGFFVLEE